jgi:hypothetical protein
MGYTGFSRENFSSRFIPARATPTSETRFWGMLKIKAVHGPSLTRFLISRNQLSPT